MEIMNPNHILMFLLLASGTCWLAAECWVRDIRKKLEEEQKKKEAAEKLVERDMRLRSRNERLQLQKNVYFRDHSDELMNVTAMRARLEQLRNEQLVYQRSQEQLLENAIRAMKDYGADKRVVRLYADNILIEERWE